MIPLTLKPGAILRCIRSSSVGGVVKGQTYTLKGYNPNPHWASHIIGVLLVDKPNMWDSDDGGWMLDRFELVRDGDGYEYQPPDDIDLQVEARR